VTDLHDFCVAFSFGQTLNRITKSLQKQFESETLGIPINSDGVSSTSVDPAPINTRCIHIFPEIQADPTLTTPSLRPFFADWERAASTGLNAERAESF
jgi:hypothetical protein